MSTPSDPPPTYEASTRKNPTHLQVPTRNGIPPAHRRSMEDERRDLPAGWVRTWDPESQHQFFVDTRADPPRSIWHHPYDDDAYLGTLSEADRERVTRLHHSVSLKDIEAESSDDEAGPSSSAGPSASASNQEQPSGLHKYTRKLKDRLTHSTHDSRANARSQRAQSEQQAYELHLAFRRAFQLALQTGQPQSVARDRDGHDVYIEPPGGPRAPAGARGYNPYSSGVYADPNARFVRPRENYGRPYGYGYGGGYGFPIAGGLLGGMMLGGLLF